MNYFSAPGIKILPTIENYLNYVCKYFKQNPKEVLKIGRKPEHVKCRQISMYFCYKYLTKDMKEIGNKIGNKDRATAWTACSKVENFINIYPSYKAEIEEIDTILKP